MYDAKQMIQSLTRGLTLLDCFQSDTEEYGITDLSVLVGQPESTVQRIVITLEFKGLIIQNPVTKKYRLTLKVLSMHSALQQSQLWLDKAKKHMQRLNEQTGETINIAIRNGNQLVYLEKIPSRHLLRPNFELGACYPLYCTGLGKCLMSDLAESDIRVLLQDPLEKLTPGTKVSIPEISKDLRTIREKGYFVDDEEFNIGLYCVAAPIYAFSHKVIAALSVSVPKARITRENVCNIINHTLFTAKTISGEYQQLFPAAQS